MPDILSEIIANKRIESGVAEAIHYNRNNYTEGVS